MLPGTVPFCCGDPQQLREAVASSKTIRLARRTQMWFAGKPLRDARCTEHREKARETNKAPKKRTGGTSTGLGSTRDRYFGLPLLDQDYEPDPRPDSDTGFGNGLKRYAHRKTRMPRAVLSIPKAAIPEEITSEEIDRQLRLLCKLDHPNIVAFRECCEDSRHLKLVYEWCEGGLFVHQLDRYVSQLTEGHLAQIMREVFSALASANSFGVHHLDIGLLCLFLQYTDRLSPIKIFGIGIAGYLVTDVSRRKFSKTNKHFYASPEVFQSRIRGMPSAMKHACDIWSVGALLFTLCSGRPPFGAGSIKEVSATVQKAIWTFGLEFSDYSSTLKDLLEQLLKLPWNKRPTATGLLSHPWLSSSQTGGVRDTKVAETALRQLHAFVQQDRVRQVMSRLLTDIGLTNAAYRDLEDLFKEADLNGDGTLALAELEKVASSSKLPGLVEPQVMNQLMARIDRNRNKNIDISEFVTALILERNEADGNLIKSAFSRMDKNHDGRVTKKELFKVLRQYSGTLEPEQVSKFIGIIDDDKDQKMDYEEFNKLFPRTRDKQDEIDTRLSEARGSIELAPLHLARFRETLASWIRKLTNQRDKIEVACGVRPLPENVSSGAAYSYELGHFSEFEVHAMIKKLVDLLSHPPGRVLTHAQKKAKHEHQQAVEKSTKGGAKSLVGLTILSAMRKDGSNDEDAIQNTAGDPVDQDGSGDEQKTVNNAEKASHRWAVLSAADRKEKMHDPEYRPEAALMDHLYWLVKVKSDVQWQPPLFDTVRKLQDGCVEEAQEFTVERRADIARVRNCLNEAYVVREDTKFAEDTHILKKGAKLLPMGSFSGKSFSTTAPLDKMEDMRPPLKLVFAWAKEDVTQPKLEHMRAIHKEKMVWVGKFCTDIIRSLEQLFEDVAEDLTMSGALESLIPSPPSGSCLYLKYCEGRGSADDAPTPRSSDLDDSEEEDPMRTVASGGSHNHSLSVNSFTGGDRRTTKRIERNLVLMQQAKSSRDARAAKQQG